MEPVQHILSLRTEVELQVANCVAAVDAHCEWFIRYRQFFPFGWTALNEHHLLLAQFILHALSHVVQMMDMVETCREVSSGLLDIYLSSMSTHMNEVMRLLTVIATIFIPLSFVVGLYGMNFDTRSPWNMPELSAHYGYPILLLLMLGAGVAMVVYFKRKGWF